MRFKIIRIVIFSIFAVIALDLFYAQVIRGAYYYNLSVNNRIRVIPLEGQRGVIRDRNGIVLAENRLAFNVAVIPQDIQDKERLFDFLSEVLGETKKDLLQTFFMRKDTSFAPVVIADDVDKRVAMVLEENKYRFPGLYIQETSKRWYPFGRIGAHVLGYVGKISRVKIEKMDEYGYTPQSVVGYSGIEEYYDSYLMGKPGGLQIEVDSRGRQMRLLSIKEPEKGQDVQLTIDARVQQLAVDALGDSRGAVIVMNLDNGEVLGLVSAPAYDPNIFADARRQKQARMIFIDNDAPLLNRAIKGLYPPGSVFKTVVTVAGMSTGQLKTSTTFFCKGAHYLGRRRFRCAHVHGSQDLLEGIAHSCNVYFYNVGAMVGPEEMYKAAKIFDLGNLTHIDLPFEEKGYIPSKVQNKLRYNKNWYNGDTLNMSIGQGDVLVTPIQVIRMMATVARSGEEVQPHLIEQIGDQKIVSLSTVKKLPVREEIFRILQKGLRLVVADPSGTARLLDMEGFEVSGKTGTAQSVADKPAHAWFVGYNRGGKVNIAFCVFLEFGGSSYNAVRISRDLLKQLKEEGVI